MESSLWEGLQTYWCRCGGQPVFWDAQARCYSRHKEPCSLEVTVRGEGILFCKDLDFGVT